MVLDILSSVLYNVGFFGTIITIILSIIIIGKKKDSYFGLGKVLCILFIFSWSAYIIVSIFNLTTTKSNVVEKKQGAYNITDKQRM
ncbi:hypothetical protein ACOAKC_10875 [Hathewaya histolytica]|uniref:hypothetical protein n=1 Tax=Hathewaya histolytica TaxID=1498 RepID=UPI003B675BD8